MVRLLHARSSKAVDEALDVVIKKQTPFMLLVYSNQCGHCVRMMPAFNEMLAVLGAAAKHDIVKLDSASLREGPAGKTPHPLRDVILSHVNGVPFVAVMKPDDRGVLVVPLPDTNDRTVDSLSEFARKHLSGSDQPAAAARKKATASPAKVRRTQTVRKTVAKTTRARKVGSGP